MLNVALFITPMVPGSRQCRVSIAHRVVDILVDTVYLRRGPLMNSLLTIVPSKELHN